MSELFRMYGKPLGSTPAPLAKTDNEKTETKKNAANVFFITELKRNFYLFFRYSKTSFGCPVRGWDFIPDSLFQIPNCNKINFSTLSVAFCC